MYFKHNKCGSFVRQLNMYDFHKARTKDDSKEFKHEYLRRGKPEFLKYIKRKGNDEGKHTNSGPRLDLEEQIDENQANCALKTTTTLLTKIKELEETCKTYESLARLSVPIKKLKVISNEESVLLFNGLITFLDESAPNNPVMAAPGMLPYKDLVTKVTKDYISRLRAVRDGDYVRAALQESVKSSESPRESAHKVKHNISANTSMADEEEEDDFCLGKRRGTEQFYAFAHNSKAAQLYEEMEDESLESKDFAPDLLDFRQDDATSQAGSLDHNHNPYRAFF